MSFHDNYYDSKLIIDLTAIKSNYKFLQDILGNTVCGASVKADAYGLGIKPVAEILFTSGCRHFFVANLIEAIELRSILAEAYIFVLSGVFIAQEDAFLTYNLIPVLNHKLQIELWDSFAVKQQLNLPAILHVDTGMSRLGMDLDELKYLDLADYNINFLYIMSHLACSDVKDEQYNHTQLNLIKQIAQSYNIPISFVNSGGIFLGREYHFDLARPGCAIYGINPTPYTINPMQPVIKLLAKILQIRHLNKDMSVGYGKSYVAKAGTKIATIACGYADGYRWNLACGGLGYLQGYEVKLIGRVSMDLITVDVSDVPEELLYLGAEVELINEKITLDYIARQCNTISYEILTGLGCRFKKIYKL